MLLGLRSDTTGPLDISAIGLAVLSFFELLPHIAALLSVIWLGLRIYQSAYDIIQKHKGKDPNKKED